MTSIVELIDPGDRVTIVDRFGVERSGRATLRNRQLGTWVLNMGGRYGTPAVADDRNIVRVRKKNPKRKEIS